MKLKQTGLPTELQLPEIAVSTLLLFGLNYFEFSLFLNVLGTLPPTSGFKKKSLNIDITLNNLFKVG